MEQLDQSGEKLSAMSLQQQPRRGILHPFVEIVSFGKSDVERVFVDSLLDFPE
jgi:hypothetical protein